jgi:hypothetical protein
MSTRLVSDTPFNQQVFESSFGQKIAGNLQGRNCVALAGNHFCPIVYCSDDVLMEILTTPPLLSRRPWMALALTSTLFFHKIMSSQPESKNFEDRLMFRLEKRITSQLDFKQYCPRLNILGISGCEIESVIIGTHKREVIRAYEDFVTSDHSDTKLALLVVRGGLALKNRVEAVQKQMVFVLVGGDYLAPFYNVSRESSQLLLIPQGRLKGDRRGCKQQFEEQVKLPKWVAPTVDEFLELMICTRQTPDGCPLYDGMWGALAPLGEGKEHHPWSIRCAQLHNSFCLTMNYGTPLNNTHPLVAYRIPL